FVVFFSSRLHPRIVIQTLSLHDALPISRACRCWTSRNDQLRIDFARKCPDINSSGPPTGRLFDFASVAGRSGRRNKGNERFGARSEEHTSELQSREKLVCRLLLENKKLN